MISSSKSFRPLKRGDPAMTGAEYDAWIKIAQESSYKQFASEVSDGKKLIDEALAVK